MIVLNGKYGYAQIFLPNLEFEGDGDYVYLDLNTREQIESFLNNPSFKGRKIRIMPDVHFGKGSCVGFTMDFGEYIIPNIIGVDIGCGILTRNLGNLNLSTNDLNGLDNFIKKNIPSGFSVFDSSNNIDRISADFLREIKQVSIMTKQVDKLDRIRNSVGTLGGGNHFIEVGTDSVGNTWLTIHSGSRNFGLQVATYYQKLADTACKSFFQDFNYLNFLPENHIGYHEYLYSMKIAQEYASLNRLEMAKTITDGFFNISAIENQIDSVHNYIDFSDNIIRKGATSAHEGQKLVIPFNMEDGLIIATGKGNNDWNNSAPHGAGRILSRKKAKESLSLEKAQEGMNSAGVFTTSLSKDTLDEAKGAYKDKDLILDMIKDTVEVDTFVKPIYNFKAR